ncbi:MAG TPA: hypothetical protein VMU99_04465 [Acidimicrobiales bacterium]|nr:hypothetical protein [Acidimicrobiales bacterium]
MDNSQWTKTKTPESREFFERIKVATKLSSKLSAYCLDEADSIRAAFEELIDTPVGDTFPLMPPF